MTKARDLGDFISDGTIAETVTADGLNLGDNEKIQLGASQDLQIFHDGSNSYINDAGTGSLLIQANGALDINKYTGENMARFFADGEAQLYFDGAIKLATKATGIDVTGTVAVSGSFNATSGTFTVQSNGTDILNVTSTEMTPQTDGAISLGSATNGFNNMYLDGSAYVGGNVGIDDSNPNAPLVVNVATDANLAVQNTGGRVQLQGINDAKNAFTTIDIAGNPITFSPNSSEAMRIDSSGDVGIGTTSPAGYKLHVADETPTVRISGTAETAGLSQYVTFGTPSYNRSSIQSTNVGTQGADLKFLTAPSGGNTTERMRIGSSGQIGLSGANYGTSGQVLTSGGSGAAPTWADAGGGAFEVLSDTSFTSAGDVEFTVTAGRVYKFEFLGISVNNTIGGSQMLWRSSATGGASFDTIFYSVRRSYSSATTFSSTNGSGSYGSLTYFNVPQTNADSTFNGEMFYYQPSGEYPFANSMFQNGDTTPGTSLGGYRIGTTSTVNLLRFQPNSDSIAGRIRVLRSV